MTLVRPHPLLGVLGWVLGSLFGGTLPADIPEPRAIDRLIRLLGSDSFDERDAASKSLGQMGDLAIPALRHALRSDDLEVRRRAESLVEAAEDREEGRLRVAVEKWSGKLQIVREEPGRRVAWVELRGGGVTDEALRGLTTSHALPLRALDLTASRVTDAGLARLKGMKELRWLSLGETGVTDTGLAYLAGLEELWSLQLQRTPVTGAGLAHLKGCKRLERLYLHQSEVTDKGLAHLSDLEGLREVHLSYTSVTDAGLAHLAGLDQLASLGLEGTRISDAGLRRLERLTGLRRLNLERTAATEEGVARLKKELPEAQVAFVPVAR
jgi:hypothetical protein